MLRFRGSDSEPEGPAGDSGWRGRALIIASPFLNFSFWHLHGGNLWRDSPIAVYGLILAAASALLAGLFFLGPSLACRQSSGGLSQCIEMSLGLMPAALARLCCSLFLMVWMSTVLGPLVFWQLPWIVRRDVSIFESGAAAIVVLVYVFLTGMQGFRTSARLALFTNKLAVAILIAAGLRVHEGWPAVPAGFLVPPDHEAIISVWHSVSRLVCYAGPLAFLAVYFSGPMQARRRLGVLALLGIALPVFGGLFLAGMLAVATHASPYYRPKFPPNIAMALWGGAAASSLAPRVMLAAITVFGGLRFGAMALAGSTSILTCGRAAQVLVPGGCVALIVGLSMYPNAEYLDDALTVLGAALTLLAAVLTADAASGWSKGSRAARRIGGTGVLAIAAGLGAALITSRLAAQFGDDTWYRQWHFPSYAATFFVCWAGRVLQGRNSVQVRADPS